MPGALRQCSGHRRCWRRARARRLPQHIEGELAERRGDGGSEGPAKALIHLGLTSAGAPALAQATGLDAAALTALATKVQTGEALLPNEVTLFGRFDAIVSAKLDTGFERADQRYRNAAKALAFGVSVVLGLVGAPIVGANAAVGLLVGVVATPLAPVAKDLASSLSAATKAISAVKR
jgi:hypothetical protein